KNKISGTVYVQFVVEKDGSISDIKVVRGIGGICDEEAVRVITKMPNWIPAKQKGIPVRSYYVIPIAFVLQ
ncbi:MAG: energy transducer TonB, partial [Bacteroidales bacterium]|nr:energy transducer TonB [Bacteroidales bacterium]